jgi:hypothetical protein
MEEWIRVLRTSGLGRKEDARKNGGQNDGNTNRPLFSSLSSCHWEGEKAYEGRGGM